MKTLGTSILSLVVFGIFTVHADELPIGEYVFKVSDEWSAQQPTSPMRQAELRFDVEGDEDPVVAFFLMGGSIEANVTRWKGQFVGEPKVESEDLAGGGVLLALSGTYLDGPPMMPASQKKPVDDYCMLAAILPGSRGLVFLKMTAPAAVLDQVRGPFDALVKSALK